MAEFQRREVTISRVEYVLKVPSDLGELAKLVAAAEANVTFNTPVHVEVGDDEIVVWFEKSRSESK